jgi:hypothetical protein
MKNMRILIVLTLLNLASIQAFGQQSIMGYTFGQSVQELQKGNEILTKNNIKTVCLTYTETSSGIFIGTRNSKNVPLNYLFKDGKLNHVASLDRCTIFGSIPSKRSLIITTLNSKSSDIISDAIYTYDLSYGRINAKIHDRKQGDVYNVAVHGDTVVCLISVKRIKQPGSDIEPKLIVLN